MNNTKIKNNLKRDIADLITGYSSNEMTSYTMDTDAVKNIESYIDEAFKKIPHKDIITKRKLAVLSAHTGVLFGGTGSFFDYIEELLDRRVEISELKDDEFIKLLKFKSKPEFDLIENEWSELVIDLQGKYKPKDELL